MFWSREIFQSSFLFSYRCIAAGVQSNEKAAKENFQSSAAANRDFTSTRSRAHDGIHQYVELRSDQMIYGKNVGVSATNLVEELKTFW